MGSGMVEAEAIRELGGQARRPCWVAGVVRAVHPGWTLHVGNELSPCPTESLACQPLCPRGLWPQSWDLTS